MQGIVAGSNVGGAPALHSVMAPGPRLSCGADRMSRSTPSTAAAAADPAPVWSNGELIVLLAVTAFAGVVRMWHLEQWSLSPIEGESWAAAVSMRGDGWEPVSSLSSRLLQFLLTTGLLPSHGEGWLRACFNSAALAYAGGREEQASQPEPPPSVTGAGVREG